MELVGRALFGAKKGRRFDPRLEHGTNFGRNNFFVCCIDSNRRVSIPMIGEYRFTSMVAGEIDPVSRSSI